MGKVPVVVELVCDDCEASGLLHIETGASDEVARCKEMFHLLPYAHLGIEHLLQVVRVADLRRIEARVPQVTNQLTTSA
jgi:hypothetical protein